MPSNQSTPQLSWDIGTAHDLFMSLDVLHHPEDFGLRGAWAAGVRSRLSQPDREVLQQVHNKFLKGPILWVYNLPAPKDSATALEALAQTPPEERFRTLLFYPNMPSQARELLELIDTRQSWEPDDVRALREAMQYDSVPRKTVTKFLDFWVQARDLGEPYLQALQAYYEVFFAEEENRIRPALKIAVEKGQQLATELDILTLLEEISQGLRFGEELRVSELVAIPSYWITPLITAHEAIAGKMLYMFGARPADASLVPGEAVPDALFQTLKALADPTRLRILRYLMAEPLTPTQLSKRLRLRTPTVVHHLKTMRLAGLVYLTLESGKRVHYTARSEAVEGMVVGLHSFLETDSGEDQTG